MSELEVFMKESLEDFALSRSEKKSLKKPLFRASQGIPSNKPKLDSLLSN
jgi:hypothetical protein